MFNLIQSGPTGGDETARYSVNFHYGDPLPTIGEFIDDILTNHNSDWGFIKVRNSLQVGSRIYSAEYRHGELVSAPPDETIKDLRLESVSASGGWSRMDYLIFV